MNALYSINRSPPLSLQLKLTEEFLTLKRYEAITTNAKFYFGEKLPTMLLRDSEDPLTVASAMKPPARSSDSGATPSEN